MRREPFLMVLALLAGACEIGERPSEFAIPGPTVPSDVPTALPHVWDTREELGVWANNQVTRGTLTLEGSDGGAFIRIERADRPWLLRGPDLVPLAMQIRTLRLRYRWRLDPT